MPDAPTPPPHVPCNFLKAGGAGFFTADCAKALASCGYSPDDFGTYDHVRKKIKAANEASDSAGTSSSASGQRTTDPLKDPTRLAGYQAGHLSQNATHTAGRRDRRGRSDPCRNPPSCRHSYLPPHKQGPPTVAVPGGGFRTARMSEGCYGTAGYQSNLAPCMPHQGSPRDPTTGHGFVTHLECEAARRAGEPGGAYPIAQEKADADARTRALLKQHGNGMPRPATPTSTSGASALGASTDDVSAAGTPSDVSQGTPTNPSQVDAGGGDIDKAAECINAFREQSLKAMQSNCVENKDYYASRAGTPAERAAALRERNDAYRAMQAARAAEPPDPAAVREAEQHYMRVAAKHNRMQRSACLAQQAAFLEQGGTTPRRIPYSNNDPGAMAAPRAGGRQISKVSQWP